MENMRGGQPRQGGLFANKALELPDLYYTGDKPNWSLRSFVESHLNERPYDPIADTYDVSAFDRPIETSKATSIYNMHSYWSKKPHEAIRRYIQHYTRPGDLVLDPFCGSGGTALAALVEGRKVVAADLSPGAAFITAGSLRILSCTDFAEAVDKLTAAFQPIGDRRFRFQNPPGVVRAVVYTEVFRCSRCFDPVHFIRATAGDERQFRGRMKAKEQCPRCGEPVRTQSDERLGFIPAEVHVAPNHRSRTVKIVDVIERADIADQFPVRPRSVPVHLQAKLEGNIQPRLWKNLAKAGACCVGDLFSDANLAVLLGIKEEIGRLEGVSEDSRVLLELAVHGILCNCTRMYRHRVHTAGGGGFSGTYYIPHLSKCINPWLAFLDKTEEIIKAIAEAQTAIRSLDGLHAVVSCVSATEIASNQNIPPNNVDYIFTDPPYGGTYHYGALNFLWEAWRKCDLSWRSNEIIITEDGALTYHDWSSRMLDAMKQCFAVLKPGRWASLCFHGEVELWEALNDIMAEAGFIPAKAERALFIDTAQKSYNQLTGATVKKRDLVISFRKPMRDESPFRLLMGDWGSSGELLDNVREAITSFLSSNPGASKDRVYDEIVSALVSRGRMQAHDFDHVLSSIAERAGDNDDRWYLKESEDVRIDAAESAKEDLAATRVARFISQQLSSHPEEQGVHYSDIVEYFLYQIQDKPRRQLHDWLLDYCYKTPEGTYRLPASKDEVDTKAQARAAGTNRRIKRYVTYIQHGVPVPERERPSDTSLAEWIRQCKRTGLYEQGKLLYERGGLNLGKLSEQAMVDVEEDYNVCARMLARSVGGEGGGKRSGGKAGQGKLF